MIIKFCDSDGNEVGTPETLVPDKNGNMSGEGNLPAGATVWKAAWQRNWDDGSGSVQQVNTPPGFQTGGALGPIARGYVYMGGPIAVSGDSPPAGRLYAFEVVADDRASAEAIADAVLTVGLSAVLPTYVNVWFWAESTPSSGGLRWLLADDEPFHDFHMTWNGAFDYETLETVAMETVVNGWHLLIDQIPQGDINMTPDEERRVTNRFAATYTTPSGSYGGSYGIVVHNVP